MLIGNHALLMLSHIDCDENACWLMKEENRKGERWRRDISGSGLLLTESCGGD